VLTESRVLRGRGNLGVGTCPGALYNIGNIRRALHIFNLILLVAAAMRPFAASTAATLVSLQACNTVLPPANEVSTIIPADLSRLVRCGR